MKVWLDDTRPMPPDYDVHARTAGEAIAFLATGRVTHISLDNDLGPPEAGEGYDVAKWIEKHAFLGQLPKISCLIHSQNTVASSNMLRALGAANYFWTKGPE